MCYGGCDCQRCSGEPPVIQKSDRQQCSDDWQDHLAWLEENKYKSIPIFVKEYEGFESLQDWDRDMSEALNGDYNPQVGELLLGEFDGTLQVVITYTPKRK